MQIGTNYVQGNIVIYSWHEVLCDISRLTGLTTNTIMQEN